MGSHHGAELTSADLDRLDSLEEVFDPVSFAWLDALGVGRGARCLEVAAGAGSCAVHLANRVGRRGRVLATDVDLRWLEQRQLPNLERRRQDLTGDDLGEAGFDVVHGRLVLHHLGGRAEAVVARLASLLAPGGRLLLEEPDLREMRVAPGHARADELAGLIERVRAAQEASGQLRARIGRELPQMAIAAGLEVDETRVHVELTRGGDPFRRWLAQAWDAAWPRLVEEGAVTAGELALALDLLADPSLWCFSFALVGVFARAPI